VPPGAVLTKDDVRSIRPGYGLEPAKLPQVLGRTAVRALKRGEPFSLDMIGG
jgi:sialic acid synthase SpsE